jgi:hypothetical protein
MRSYHEKVFVRAPDPAAGEARTYLHSFALEMN